MAMPRPSGKARKIAMNVIPGINRNAAKKGTSKPKILGNDDENVEMKVTRQNADMNLNKTISSRARKKSMW